VASVTHNRLKELEGRRGKGREGRKEEGRKEGKEGGRMKRKDRYYHCTRRNSQHVQAGPLNYITCGRFCLTANWNAHSAAIQSQLMQM
jgi:hypothetical protein